MYYAIISKLLKIMESGNVCNSCSNSDSSTLKCKICEVYVCKSCVDFRETKTKNYKYPLCPNCFFLCCECYDCENLFLADKDFDTKFKLCSGRRKGVCQKVICSNCDHEECARCSTRICRFCKNANLGFETCETCERLLCKICLPLKNHSLKGATRGNRIRNCR